MVATVWVKIPILIPINNIYIYYDNPIASSISSGSSTFMFFDDGEGKTPGSNLTTGGWTNVAYGTYSNDIAYSGSISLKLDAPGTSYGTAFRTVTKPTPNSWILETKVYDLISGGTYDFAQFVIDDTSTRQIGLRWEKNIAGNNYNYIIDATKITTSITRSVGWHTFRIVYDGSNLSLFIDNIQVKSPSAYSDITYRLGIYGQDNNGVWFDNIIHRKYTSPEPTFGASGNEELNITATLMTLDKISCLGPCAINTYVTWHNYGNADITSFTTAVLIDGTTLAYGALISILAGGDASSGAITTPTLSVGSHTICPYPN